MDETTKFTTQALSLAVNPLGYGGITRFMPVYLVGACIFESLHRKMREHNGVQSGLNHSAWFMPSYPSSVRASRS